MNSNMQVHKYTKSGPPSHLNNCAYLKGTNIWLTFGVVFCFDPMGGEAGEKFVWREQRTLCRVSDCLFLMSKSSPICHSHLQHHHSNNITIANSVFTIAFWSSDHYPLLREAAEGKMRNFYGLSGRIPSLMIPNDTMILMIQFTIYNLQFTINGLSGRIPNLMILMILMIPPLMQIQLRKIFPNKIHRVSNLLIFHNYFQNEKKNWNE